jgi:PTS system mannose-specific IIA component
MLLIGIVLVSHGPLAEGFKAAAEMIVGPQERFIAVGMDPSADLDVLRDEIAAAVMQVSGASDTASFADGAEVRALVLADLMGGSPANSSATVALAGIPVICGVNLPMLLEVLMSRAHSSAQELAKIALRAGGEGVVDLGKALTGQ